MIALRRRGLRRSVAVAVAVACVLVAATAGCAEDGPRRETAMDVSGSPDRSMPAGAGVIEPGTYGIPASAWSVADFEVTFPEGWRVQYGHVFSKNEDEASEVGFYAVVVDEVYTDACDGEGVATAIGPEVDDLVTALRAQSGPVVGAPVSTRLGGHPAVRVELEVPEDLDLESCRLGEVGLQVWYSAPADKYFVLLPDGDASVYILEVDGRRQVFLTQHRSGASSADLAELQAVLDSIRIGD